MLKLLKNSKFIESMRKKSKYSQDIFEPPIKKVLAINLSKLYETWKQNDFKGYQYL